jgi:DNA-damage-inducible protein D
MLEHEITPFEAIRQTDPEGSDFWSSRDFAKVLGYANYRHFLAVIEKAKIACENSGQVVSDHMVGIGKGAKRPVKTIICALCEICG